MECQKCNLLMAYETWAKKLSPNVYRLYDKHICPKCKALKVEEVAKIDKNTDETRKILADMKAQAIAKIPKISLRSPMKEETDVASLFNKKK